MDSVKPADITFKYPKEFRHVHLFHFLAYSKFMRMLGVNFFPFSTHVSSHYNKDIFIGFDI